MWWMAWACSNEPATKSEGETSETGTSSSPTSEPGPTGIEACVVHSDGSSVSPASVFVVDGPPSPPIQHLVDATGCALIEEPAGTTWQLQGQNEDGSCFSEWTTVDVPDGDPIHVDLDIDYLCAG